MPNDVDQDHRLDQAEDDAHLLVAHKHHIRGVSYSEERRQPAHPGSAAPWWPGWGLRTEPLAKPWLPRSEPGVILTASTEVKLLGLPQPLTKSRAGTGGPRGQESGVGWQHLSWMGASLGGQSCSWPPGRLMDCGPSRAL